MSRQRIYCCAATALFLLLLCVGGSVLTARQEPAKRDSADAAGRIEERNAPAWTPSFAKAEATIDKMFAEYDLKPHPLPAIPDDPPPHEGAMIGYPIVIEPPDLILIEVLEALPGRPISGERLVRYDGMISLGFYGEVHVAGLTAQASQGEDSPAPETIPER